MTAPEQPAPTLRLRRGQVVEYVWHDPILGTDLRGLAVVTAVPAEDGSPATVRPLADAELQVDPAQLAPASADVVAGS